MVPPASYKLPGSWKEMRRWRNGLCFLSPQTMAMRSRGRLSRAELDPAGAAMQLRLAGGASRI